MSSTLGPELTTRHEWWPGKVARLFYSGQTVSGHGGKPSFVSFQLEFRLNILLLSIVGGYLDCLTGLEVRL